MKGTVLGIRKLDFKDKDENKIDMTQYWIGFNAKGTEGMQAEKISFDPKYEKMPAPDFAVGEVVQVERNTKGKLIFSEEE
ncbi:MAG: hypothetical protein FWG31_09465 [Oscillospiraceae bacterium]|nr:hypothetical protein [Oscillospiraceae bacterium]